MLEQLEDLDATEVLARALDRRHVADCAEAELLALAALWADLHAVLDGEPDGFRVPGMQRLVPLAGKGAPQVAEFAPAELAAALGMSTFGGQGLVGDALELRHRLPRLWARVQAGTLQAWRARQVADRTKILSLEAAGFVDAQVAPFAHKIGLGQVLRLVEAAVIRFDPHLAAARAKAAADGRRVFVSDQMTNGTRSIRIETDALDATAFDDTLNRIADALSQLGDQDRKDVRRAKAVGVVADPQGALDLLSDEPDDTGETAAAGSAHSRIRRRSAGQLRVILYVHLYEAALAGTPGVGRVEGLGPVTTDQIRDWVRRTDVHVTVTPVQDLADRASVDAYEVPDRMRETVILRNPCCPFPWCTNQSRHKDVDHVKAFVPEDDGGPPGQTAADKLAGLCRRHHRLKTHHGWTYTMPESGIHLWTSPAGRRYLVDHTGTIPLQCP
jgi:Domain of unknown function (DUF222)